MRFTQLTGLPLAHRRPRRLVGSRAGAAPGVLLERGHEHRGDAAELAARGDRRPHAVSVHERLHRHLGHPGGRAARTPRTRRASWTSTGTAASSGSPGGTPSTTGSTAGRPRTGSRATGRATCRSRTATCSTCATSGYNSSRSNKPFGALQRGLRRADHRRPTAARAAGAASSLASPTGRQARSPTGRSR